SLSSLGTSPLSFLCFLLFSCCYSHPSSLFSPLFLCAVFSFLYPSPSFYISCLSICLSPFRLLHLSFALQIYGRFCKLIINLSFCTFSPLAYLYSLTPVICSTVVFVRTRSCLS